MGWIKSLRDQARDFWRDTSMPARIGILAASALVLAVFIGVGFWSSRPQYVPLAVNLAPAEAAEIVSKLDGQGIANKLNFAGSAVLVPKSQWNRARLVAGDLIGPAAAQVEDLGSSLLSDPDLNHFKMVRYQEKRLARTIEQMRAVERATVHISQAENTPFISERQPASASVVLQLRRGATFSHEQAAAIVAMMANSVEGLEPDQVTVMDTSGRVFSSQFSASDADIASQYEYRQRLQADLAAKAEMMLDRLLGPGRSVVRVAADVDFTQTERIQTTYDPDAKVKRMERIRTTSRTATAAAPPAGPAGTASNLGAGGLGNKKLPTLEKEEDIETEYENAKTVDTIKEAFGTIKRLTVAAIVELPETEDQNGAATPVVTKEDVERILKQAVGFDPTRSDQIEVLISKLAAPTAAPAPALASPVWDTVNQLLRNASLGLAAIVALVVSLMILRKMKPVEITPPATGMLTIEQAQRIADLSQQAAADPEAISKVVRAWLGEPIHEEGETGGGEQEGGRPMRAAA